MSMLETRHRIAARFKPVLLSLLFVDALAAAQDHKPREVFLSLCKLDRTVRPCEEFQIGVRVGRRVVRVRQFMEKHGLREFRVPDQFKSAT